MITNSFVLYPSEKKDDMWRKHVESSSKFAYLSSNLCACAVLLCCMYHVMYAASNPKDLIRLYCTVCTTYVDCQFRQVFEDQIGT